MKLLVKVVRKGVEKTLTPHENVTLEQLLEWQERWITFPEHESITILKDGEVYSTLEA